MTESELAGAVCARICHDLANPVGAIVNGTDLIREIGAGAATRELTLVEQSARRAAAVLQFHRLAFGTPRDPDAALARGHLHERIAAVISGPRVTLTWSVHEGSEIGHAPARLAALMVLAGRAMLGAGGELRVLIPPDAALPLSVMAEGPRAAATSDQRGWLRGDTEILPDSRHVEFALLPHAATAAGARLELVEDSNRLTLRALPG
jgi:histidine phosphotransferase ChpT